MITMENLAEKLPQTTFRIYNTSSILNVYYRVNTLTKAAVPQDNTLYVGYASALNECFLCSNKIGLILLKDIDINFTQNTQCEVAFCNNTVDFMELFYNIQMVFQTENEYISDMSILLDGLMRGKNMAELIDIGSKLLGNAIMLTNSSYRVVAMSNDVDVDDPVWNDAKKYGCCSAESIAVFKGDEAATRLFNSSTAFIYDTGLGANMPRILRKITVYNKAAGYICVFESKTKLQKKHLEMTDILCNLLAVEMKNSFSAGDFTDKIYESLIYDLLNSKIHGDISLNQRIIAANWVLKPFFCVLKIEVKKEGNNSYYCEYIREQLEQSTPFGKAIIYDNNIVLLLNYSQLNEYKNSMVQIKKVIEGNELHAGTSRIFHNLSELKDYYTQASVAFGLGEILQAEDNLHSYEDFCLYHLISKMNKKELKGIFHPDYYKLMEYDKKNQTDFCHTLYVYFECGDNISIAANKLFIHRNTMTYRMKKISKIVNIDLANGEEICKFILTDKINRWLEIDS